MTETIVHVLKGRAPPDKIDLKFRGMEQNYKNLNSEYYTVGYG